MSFTQKTQKSLEIQNSHDDDVPGGVGLQGELLAVEHLEAKALTRPAVDLQGPHHDGQPARVLHLERPP